MNITGYAVLEFSPRGPITREAGVVRGGKGGPLADRLKEIHRGLVEVISQHQPTVVAIEQLYSHYAHPRTAILMGHARGVICLAAAEADVPVVSYSATRIKKILTGNGRAPKSQIQRAVQQELRLPTIPEPPDVADALAIALSHYYLARRATTDAAKPRR